MTRRKLDQYDTPAGMTHALVENRVIAGTVLECCSGNGAIVDVLRHTQRAPISDVITNDIDPKTDAMYHYDAADPELYRQIGRRPHWIVTNPPFNEATDILELALANARVGVAFLLRLTYLEPTSGRAQLLHDYADSMTGILTFGQPRPNFRRGEINPRTGKAYGTDNATSAWFVWRVGFSWAKIEGVYSPFSFITDWN